MYSSFGTGFGSESDRKCNTKVIKSKIRVPSFWETMLLLVLKRQDFFRCWKNVLNKPESGTELQRSQNRNHNNSLCFHSTSTKDPDPHLSDERIWIFQNGGLVSYLICFFYMLGECAPLQACADNEEITGSDHRGRWRARGPSISHRLPQVCPGQICVH